MRCDLGLDALQCVPHLSRHGAAVAQREFGVARTVATGVRSSWLASAAKRRSRSSPACRRASASPTWPSMWLSAAPTWPTSVRGSVSGTGSGMAISPLARGSRVTSAAVAATRRSGRRDRRTHSAPASPVASEGGAEHGGLDDFEPVHGLLDRVQRQTGDQDVAVVARDRDHPVR